VAVEALVHEAEATFSRFRPDSALSRLNRDRATVHPGLVALVTRALELGAATNGAFDIRVGPALVTAGYDRSFELLGAHPPAPERLLLAAPVALLEVAIAGDSARLEGVGALDLGGIAKGWTIDRVAELLLANGCADFVIDGGGDIRTGGSAEDGAAWTLGVGDGLAVHLSDGAVCTSSTVRRRWRTVTGEAHHIIDPWTGASAQAGVTTAVVVADDAVTADGLATAIVASPADGLSAASALRAEVLLERDGRWQMTPGLERFLV
jgi:thiamine biosynthesis lipoprotein